MERGSRQGSIRTPHKIANALDVDRDDLMTGD